MSFAWHPYLDPDLVQADLTRPIARDPLGHRIHLACALLFCFLLTWPVSIVQFAGLPLMVIFALRVPHIWRTWGSLAVQPLLIAIAVFAAWLAISLLWTPDLRQGLGELSDTRWVWILWLFWPVMMHRRLLIAALAIGFFCGMLSQLLHVVGLRAGIDWLVWPRLPDRNSGWWDPVVGGTMLIGALGLHLPAAVMGRGRVRLLAIAAAAVTLVAIFATGTRGAWIAAAALVALTIAIAMAWHVGVARGTPLVRRLSPLLMLSAAALIVGVLAFALVGDSISRRIAEARHEIARIVDHGDYETYTGARILMARCAMEALRDKPVFGTGAGGYQSWSRQQLARRDQQHLAPYIHSHAHNAALHIAATLGIVGLALAAAIIALTLRGGLALDPGRLGTYDAGPAFAILGLVLVSATDVVHMNSQTVALLATLMALCLISRPRPIDLADLRPDGSTMPALNQGALQCPESAPSALSRSTP
jgi:O-antigen ligase